MCLEKNDKHVDEKMLIKVSNILLRQENNGTKDENNGLFMKHSTLSKNIRSLEEEVHEHKTKNKFKSKNNNMLDEDSLQNQIATLELSNVMLQENNNTNLVRTTHLHNQLDDKNLCLTEKSNKSILTMNTLKNIKTVKK